MTPARAPVTLTTRALTLGTLVSAALLGVGLALDVAGLADAGGQVGNIGVVLLLATPVAGLLTSWWELRGVRPRAAWLAVAVLCVLALAILVAVFTRG
jgi:hypothetical protein